MACIDMNAWLSRIDRPGRPNFVLFDWIRRPMSVSVLLPIALSPPRSAGS